MPRKFFTYKLLWGLRLEGFEPPTFGSVGTPNTIFKSLT